MQWMMKASTTLDRVRRVLRWLRNIPAMAMGDYEGPFRLRSATTGRLMLTVQEGENGEPLFVLHDGYGLPAVTLAGLDEGGLVQVGDGLRTGGVVLQAASGTYQMALVDDEGVKRATVTLDTTGDVTDGIEIRNQQGERVVSTGETTDGAGILVLCAADGQLLASMGTGGHGGGGVAAYDAGGRAVAGLVGTGDGGAMVVSNPASGAGVKVAVDREAGIGKIDLTQRSGDVLLSLPHERLS